MRRKRSFAAGALCALLLVTGCSTADSAPSTDRTEAVPPPPPDKGPLCAGDEDGSPRIAGVHVLRGGMARLPGGAVVWYTEARSDGRSRQAVLVEAATPADRRDGRRRTVAPRSELTVDGRRYTVRQVCAYRVVLTPRDAPVPTPAPVPSGENAWPPLAGGRWRLRWHAPQARYTGGNESVVLYDVHDGPKRAHIGVTANKRDGGALYDDARIGDTLEIAGRLWRVAGIGLGKTDVGEGDREFRAGYVDLRPVG